MKDVLKEVAPQFKVLKKSILDYHKEIKKAKKVAEHEAKKAVTAAERAERACAHVRGSRGDRRGRGKGRGRGARERDIAASASTDNSDQALDHLVHLSHQKVTLTLTLRAKQRPQSLDHTC